MLVALEQESEVGAPDLVWGEQPRASELDGAPVLQKDALTAFGQRRAQGALIRHSDRGTPLTSHEYQHFLNDRHLTLSMSAVGYCGDSAPAEGFLVMLQRARGSTAGDI